MSLGFDVIIGSRLGSNQRSREQVGQSLRQIVPLDADEDLIEPSRKSLSVSRHLLSTMSV